MAIKIPQLKDYTWIDIEHIYPMFGGKGENIYVNDQTNMSSTYTYM